MAENISIVEDDLDSLLMVGLLLRRSGYEIQAASNDLDAMVQANTHFPDMIILQEELVFNQKKISPMSVNRIRSENHTTWTNFQEKLEYPVPVMILPSPEDKFQADRNQTTAVTQLPNSSKSQQFKNLADLKIGFSTQNQ